MGKIKNNVVTKGFSGKFGDDLMFRQVDNQTVFVKRSLLPRKSSAQQTAVRNNFAEASNFASNAMNNPQASQDYKLMAEVQGLKSAYLAALTDFLTLPEIGKAFVATYKGNVGDMINIKPKVAYKVVEIEVTILGADGTVLESGKAVPSELKWRYITTVVNAQVKGSKLVMLARDRQGKESTLEQLL